jgi:ankyrin repeat protein
MVLVQNKRLDCFKWLLAQGFSMACVDNERMNVLHYVIESLDSDLALLILGQGDLNFSDLSKPHETGYFMIQTAVLNGMLNVVKILQQKGCSVEQLDSHGNTLLHLCAFSDPEVD